MEAEAGILPGLLQRLWLRSRNYLSATLDLAALFFFLLLAKFFLARWKVGTGEDARLGACHRLQAYNRFLVNTGCEDEPIG